jgi:hypothetical protein
LPAVSFFFLGAGTVTQQRRVQVKGHGDDASFSLLATPTEQKEEASRGKAYEETGGKSMGETQND